ncbi:Ferrous iron transport protein B [Dissulfuribacter thermophilus]|uniref:Ferrous iron transport protein B n=1 Tax=Dissulfuribacter thermophilus TaxID=1156395 RepID=A0A1B9F817_9BACT|nr:ferrous iron transport protein B [Dissulfuribacter thermophilus]OCC16023.1 Ferrous iron transport protein B [Dissulfuribacter thermophilus]
MELTIALCGNPNAGKTTIFNQLTGARQKVGNWPGVTVEKKEGVVTYKGNTIKVVDLPGIYSLTAYSVEELVARDYILDQKPDVVVDVIDASNLERNLYLATQLIELNIRLVFAMNMVDVARSRGIVVDYSHLSRLLGVPIIETVGTKGEGIHALLDKVLEVAQDVDPVARHIHVNYGSEVEEEIRLIREVLKKDPQITSHCYPRWTAVKLLEGDPQVIKWIEGSPAAAEILEQVRKSAQHISSIFDDEPETIIAEARYGFISGALKETMKLSSVAKKTISDTIDQVVTNRLLGYPVFLLFMYLLFQMTFTLGQYPVSWIEKGLEALSYWATLYIPPGDLQGLIVDGIIGGVGGVLVFLPYILLLFLGISILEDSGYMARAAFIMDKVMHTLGLHGKSFIPLLMGFGCNVPAIMAARTLESRRDRILTILINPLMSCSARLPVYVLIAGAFFQGREANVIFSVYLIGIILAVLVGRLFSKTLFKGDAAPFVMELPPYRLPTFKSLLIHMWDRAKIFLRKMSGVVLVFSIIIWFLGSFPKDVPYSMDYEKEIRGIEAKLAQNSLDVEAKDSLLKRLQELEVQMHQEKLTHSYIGRMGHFIEPVLKPLGFDWRLGISLITGFVAKEVVVSTLGVLYQAGGEDENSGSLRKALRESGLTPLTAYAFMVFVLIYVPCMVTVTTIWRETGSYAWTAFSVSYLMVLAWIVSFMIVSIGRFFSIGT